MDFYEVRNFANIWHSNQMYGPFPYMFHLEEVVKNLKLFGYEDTSLLYAAYLHDILEDTHCTFNNLIEFFGQEIADIVLAVTDEPGETRRERKLATYPKIRANDKAIPLKLADRITNIECCIKMPNSKKYLKNYREEQEEFANFLYRVKEDKMWRYIEIRLDY